MHTVHRITCYMFAGWMMFFSSAPFAAETTVTEEKSGPVIPEAVIVGNPPADHPFGKLKIGMKYEEVVAIVGKPTNETIWCTGKQFIPFYFGDDRGRAEAFFKGMGKLDFNASVSVYPFHICKGDTPLDLVYIEYDPENTGELPK